MGRHVTEVPALEQEMRACEAWLNRPVDRAIWLPLVHARLLRVLDRLASATVDPKDSRLLQEASICLARQPPHSPWRLGRALRGLRDALDRIAAREAAAGQMA